MGKFRGDPRHTLVELRLLAFVGIYFLCQDASDLCLGLKLEKGDAL